MDDSWRMLIGMTESRKSRKPLPRRRSTEDTWTLPQRPSAMSLGPEDFSDVFGGPPRTVLLRQFSATSADTSCEEMFRPPRISRERSEGFYNDMFLKTGSSTNSFSKSKSNSSSVLSSEELSPFRGMADDTLSPFSFKSRSKSNDGATEAAELMEITQTNFYYSYDGGNVSGGNDPPDY